MKDLLYKILTYQIGNVPVTKIIVIYEIIFLLYNLLFNPFYVTGSLYGISLSKMLWGTMFMWAIGVPIVFVVLLLVWQRWPKK